MVYIPGFLINKVYERGSLANTDDGFRFCFTNRMTPVRITGLRDLKLEVDAVPCPVERIRLTLGGRPIGLSGGRLEEADGFLLFGNQGSLTGAVPFQGRNTARSPTAISPVKSG